ncbi:hypothetical protein P0136_01375 [Lentisphaerota bacterium ZTH]|nr:hypothetical protein JYG24_07485 [Lentisphaerota bacterium]WET06665.1 hypothetical protein P0136_01375 [Lentisphaerota bacterium ZTH]
MISIPAANEYLQRHLKHAAWSAFDDSAKAGALKMAENDVSLFLGIESVDESRIFQLCAVFEQAVFLLENYDSFAAGIIVESEKVDGVGSISYKTGNETVYGPRTLAFLNRECSGNRLGRG